MALTVLGHTGSVPVIVHGMKRKKKKGEIHKIVLLNVIRSVSLSVMNWQLVNCVTLQQLEDPTESDDQLQDK